MKPFDKTWIVLACDENFIITNIITIKNLKINIKVKDSASKIVVPYDLPKFLDFTQTLKNQKVIFGDNIGVVDHNSTTTLMDFGGVAYENSYIITVFSNYLALYNELIKIDIEPINQLREKMIYFSVSPGNYQELSSLNNDLINTQRELYKKNVVIQDLMNKKEKMNRKLEVLNATKDRIFSIIGHDLRAPLGNIIQSMNLIAHDHLVYEEWKLIMLDNIILMKRNS